MRISGYPGVEGRGFTPHAPARSHAPVSSEKPTGSASPANRLDAAASQSTTTSLSLTTAEGDKVILSFSSGSTSAVASEGTDYASIRSRSSEVKIQVEGDLSADELKDIRKLAKIVSRAASDILRGDTQHAAQRVEQANHLGSIQSFAFSLNQQVDYRFNYQQGSTPDA